MDPQPAMYPAVAAHAPPANYVVHHHGAQYPSAPVMYPAVAGYAPPASYAVHHQGVQYPGAPVVRDGYGTPYVYTQEVKPPHGPYCRYVSPERRRKNGIANALAALFIVCWCCTWPCHGPCCCGM